MRKLYLFIFLLISLQVNAQHKKTDTLLVALNKANTDTAKLVALLALGNHYYLAYPDSAILFGQQAYGLAKKNNWKKAGAKCLNSIANAYATIGDYVNGMQYYMRSLRISESVNYLFGTATEYNNIGATYIQEGEYKKALPYLFHAQKDMNSYLATNKITADAKRFQLIVLENLGEGYLYLHQVDSANYYLDLCYPGALKDNQDILGPIERDLGEVYEARSDKAKALDYLRRAIGSTKADDDVENQSIAELSIANFYHKYKQQDSAEYYAKKALETASAGKYEQDVLNAGQVLYKYYDEDNNLPQAYKYYKLTTEAKDSLFSQDKVKQLLSLDFDEKQRQEDIIAAQEQYRDKIRTYIFIAGLMLLLLLVIIFWRNGRQRQKANHLLESQKHDLEAALAKLQLTQNQLIQSEKMASLGELTAGIAHEIQNPLNFVNNFSEVSIELSYEMKDELKQGNPDIAMAIADDIEQNLQKIIHHGKRADSIVKGMLQHSRAGSTIKELTDINALTDEYLRLAYHGLRAKDKTFNAELVTGYAKNLPKANVLPQDIGRVLLNLYTNAFYAVHQKQQKIPTGYTPTVQVGTSFQKGNIVIKVKDNGMGMPDEVKDKIMQPFFTTKPTGQGTGLGLSLSYDIVVKGHNGNIDVDTKENEYTEFTITIPQ